jgi:hypothetical protein
LLTAIGHEEILGSVFTEHGVALEDRDGLSSGVGDRDLGDMVVCAHDLNREWAGSHGGASQRGNGEDVGNHAEIPRLRSD